MKNVRTALLGAALLLTALFAADHVFFNSMGRHRLRACHLIRSELWSLGIARGDHPFRLRVADHPLLRARDITDTAARMVADPFAVYTNGQWHLFFEIDSVSTRQGEIGLAVSTDTTNWVYRRVVLDEPFHLSYPQVFAHDGSWYMIPESHQAGAVRLYRANRFPDRWVHLLTLVRGPHKDPTLLRHAGRWWLFTCTGQNEQMHIYYADRLTGPWAPHAQNPVIDGDRTRARCGGPFRTLNGKTVRMAQDCLDRYGHRLLGFEILELSPDRYAERPLPENPLLEPDGTGWNAFRMHQLDLHQTPNGTWIGFTDGNAR